MAQWGHEAGAAIAAALPEVDDLGRPVRITVLTRAGCHLCEVALRMIDAVIADAAPPVGCAAIDIDRQNEPAAAELAGRYGDWLPVIFVDGRQHDYWSVDPVRLNTALRAP
ncbi:hypothetical protein BH23ACT6_BH23ACT6_05290 [soil metagenome]